MWASHAIWNPKVCFQPEVVLSRNTEIKITCPRIKNKSGKRAVIRQCVHWESHCPWDTGLLTGALLMSKGTGSQPKRQQAVNHIRLPLTLSRRLGFYLCTRKLPPFSQAPPSREEISDSNLMSGASVNFLVSALLGKLFLLQIYPCKINFPKICSPVLHGFL